MKKILIQYGVCALAVALMVPLARAQSQPAGLQAAFAKDAGTLSDKFAGLARVMSGKYDWKPAQGVRSVADVFNLIVKENGLLAGVLLGTPNTGAPPAPITDPEKMQEALKKANALPRPILLMTRRGEGHFVGGTGAELSFFAEELGLAPAAPPTSPSNKTPQ
jgi:hypothetical protein